MSSRVCLGCLFAFTTIAWFTAGCSSLPAATSTAIGCYDDEIEISDVQSGPSGDTWTARCHGHTFDCARDEKAVDGQGWNMSNLKYERFHGTVSGDTYCIQRGQS